MQIKTITTENLGAGKPTIHLWFADRQGSDQLILHPPEGSKDEAVIFSPNDLYQSVFRPIPSQVPQNSPKPIRMKTPGIRPRLIAGNTGHIQPILQATPPDQQTRARRGGRSASLSKDRVRRSSLAEVLGDPAKFSPLLKLVAAKKPSQSPKRR